MMDKEANRDKYLLSSVNNALKVLDFLGVRDSASMTEICRGCKLDKTSVFKILYTLERKDYVFKTQNAKYKLGVKFMNYGEHVAERQDLVEVAAPYMQKLRDLCAHPVYLGTLNTNGKVIILHKEKSDGMKNADARIGFEMDAYTNSLGKVLLAYLHTPILHGVVEQYRFKPYTPKTILSANVLYDALEEIRENGFGEDSDEHYVGHSAVSAPIFNSIRQCVAGISIVYPTELPSDEKDELTQNLLPVAVTISERLGYTLSTGTGTLR